MVSLPRRLDGQRDGKVQALFTGLLVDVEIREVYSLLAGAGFTSLGDVSQAVD